MVNLKLKSEVVIRPRVLMHFSDHLLFQLHCLLPFPVFLKISYVLFLREDVDKSSPSALLLPPL